MNQLPLEVRVKIASFLPFNDRVKCRLVSTSFKSAVETSLASVTRVDIRLNGRTEWPGRVENGVPRTFGEEKMFCRPKDVVRVKDDDDCKLKLFAFLSTYCPFLHFLSSMDLEVTSDQLLHIAPSIQFFACKRSWLRNALVDEPESLFCPFDKLQGFEYSSSEWSVVFAKYLHKRKRPIYKIEMWNGRNIDQETLDSMARSGISCLSTSLGDNATQYICESLAKCLVDLTIYFNPSDDFCKFTLANLRHLEMKRQYLSTELNPFLCRQLTPNLVSFEYSGFIYSDLLEQLIGHIYSLETLQSVTLFLNIHIAEVLEDEGDEGKVLAFPLRPKLSELTVHANFSFRFLELSFSDSLKCLRVTRVATMQKDVYFPSFVPVRRRMNSFDFHFPNLELFDCESERSPSLPDELLRSLSRCSKLVSFCLKMTLFNLPSADDVRNLMDILSTNCRLSHLQLILYPTGATVFDIENEESPETEVDSFPGETVFLSQRNFPSLKKFEFKSLYEIVYYPTDSFNRLRVACDKFDNYSCYVQQLELTSNSFEMDYQIVGASVIPVFSSQMDKLVHLQLDFVPRPEHSLALHCLASQLHRTNNLKVFECSYRSINTSDLRKERTIENLLPKHKSHLLELAQHESFFSPENFKCLFGPIPYNRNLTKHSNPTEDLSELILELTFGAENRTTDLRVQPAEKLEKLALDVNLSLDLSAVDSQSVTSLDISGDVNVPFHLPNLREFTLKQSVRPPGPGLLDSLKKSPQLRSFELNFEQDEDKVMPDASFVNSLFQVMSSMEHLDNLTLKAETFGSLLTKKGAVFLCQEQFSSLTKLFWRLPFNLTFRPIDAFDCIVIRPNKYLFTSGSSRNGLTFEIFRKPGRVKIQFEQNMSKLFKLQINSICSLKELSPLTQAPIAEVHFDRWNSSFDKKFQTELMDWAASLPSLRTLVTEPLSQSSVERFLMNLKSTGPLTIDIGRGSTKVTRMEDRLHQLVSNLLASRVISSFKSLWTCSEEQLHPRRAASRASLSFCCSVWDCLSSC